MREGQEVAAGVGWGGQWVVVEEQEQEQEGQEEQEGQRGGSRRMMGKTADGWRTWGPSRSTFRW